MINTRCGRYPGIRDLGSEAIMININETASINNNYRTALWTGKHMQLTLMSIPVCGDIGLEMHPETDQLIRIESGYAKVYMGSDRDRVRFAGNATPDCAVFVPAGTWHNVVNAGKTPLKLSSLYAPVQHPFGTVHKTKADSESEEYR